MNRRKTSGCENRVKEPKPVHIRIYRIHEAMCNRSSDVLGSIFVEPSDGILRISIGGKNTIRLFMVIDTNRTCGLDGTQVL